MIRTSSVLFWFGLTIVASLALYRTSDRVQELNAQLREINTSIDAEQQRIHVLKAEWVYLANPARVESAARKFLPLRPTSPQQITDVASLSEMLPARSEVLAAVLVSSTPIANVGIKPLRPVVEASAAPVARIKPAVKVAATTVASADSGHINDHMIMQHTASTSPSHDSIGTLIAELSDR